MFIKKTWSACRAAALCVVALSAAPASAALPVKESEQATQLMPPLTQVLTAARAYPVTAVALTNHKGWRDSSGYVNVPQAVHVTWHVDSGGQAVLQGRSAWNAQAPWRELGRWGRGTKEPEKGATEVTVTEPTLLWLRVRATRFPKSGISRLQADYNRHTVIGLRGPGGESKRPVIMAEGYDPFNTQDWNDTAWQADPTLAKLIAFARAKYNVDAWLLDWGDGGAPLEQQAEDFADVARQVKAWNGGRRGTVAVGVSMGSVSLRYALATAATAKEDLGIQKYLSINGPHQGAWVDPKLLKFLLKRANKDKRKGASESSEAFLVRRGLDSPAAQELLIGAPRHDAFYTDLRSRGDKGYDPAIPRVAFSNGVFSKEGNGLAVVQEGKGEVVHRVRVRPLGLPVWLPFHKTYREFQYGGYPGELLPSSLMVPVRDHVRYLSLFRFDIRAEWLAVPTFIPTHSALDFPQTLVGRKEGSQYLYWRQTAFSQVYVAPGRNLAHDQSAVDWVDPRTGKGAPDGQNAILYEILQAFAPHKEGERADGSEGPAPSLAALPGGK